MGVKIEEISMNTYNEKDVRYVIYAFIIFALFIFGSILVDFKLIDIFYFIVLISCLIKHELLKKKKKDCT